MFELEYLVNSQLQTAAQWSSKVRVDAFVALLPEDPS